ncbi:glycosyl transferase [Rhodanobacter panaciterrae]|uniref:Glycosyl transferase n=2 Tax=Rhodanobacter panaciterrae TaxID=490572 RepID=A0ABQ2ZJH0_9GAMM|nr:glycosyl transferase [Rhodanobacter panaciterrae]
MQASPVVSLVVPFYNEGAAVEAFFETIASTLASINTVAFEIVCIDDGSKDDTLIRLLAASRSDPRVKIIELSRNFGKEAALTAGLDAAVGDAVIPMDADLQDPPGLIIKMIEKWRLGADVVLARRIDRHSDSIAKRGTANLFYKIHNRVSHVEIPNNVGDFRLMNRASVDALKLLPERQRFMKGMFAWIGFRTEVLDYTRPARAAGSSKFTGWKLWNFALEGFTSFSSVPLRIWTYIGSFSTLLTLVYLIFIVTRTLIYGIDVPGYASLLVSILFFGSLQLLSVGILGEYIGRIYTESKQRPVYIVRQIYGGSREP